MPKILVIDDIEFARSTISRMLKRQGFEMLEASNGKDGMKLFVEHHPDLVLTDILMPEMEGLETIRAMRKLAPELPIIAVTGSHNSPFLEMALRLGATKGLLKPFKNEDLIETVDSCM